MKWGVFRTDNHDSRKVGVGGGQVIDRLSCRRGKGRWRPLQGDRGCGIATNYSTSWEEIGENSKDTPPSSDWGSKQYYGEVVIACVFACARRL